MAQVAGEAVGGWAGGGPGGGRWVSARQRTVPRSSRGGAVPSVELGALWPIGGDSLAGARSHCTRPDRVSPFAGDDPLAVVPLVTSAERNSELGFCMRHGGPRLDLSAGRCVHGALVETSKMNVSCFNCRGRETARGDLEIETVRVIHDCGRESNGATPLR